MDEYSYGQQVEMFYETDILMGAHGSAMTNSFFLLPHSVLIEVSPPFFYELPFANIAYVCRIHHILVPNFNGSLVGSKAREAQRYYKEGSFFKYRRQFVEYPLYPNLLSIVSSIQDAVEYVQRWHFGFKVSDYWSHIFPSSLCSKHISGYRFIFHFRLKTMKMWRLKMIGSRLSFLEISLLYCLR